MGMTDRPGRLERLHALVPSWADVRTYPSRRVADWRAAARSAGRARLVYEVTMVAATFAVTLGGALLIFPEEQAGVLRSGLIALGAAVIVAARLAYPTAALLAGMALWATTGGESVVLMIVLCYSAGYRMTRWARTGAAMTVYLIVWMAASSAWLGNEGWEDLLFTAGLFPVFAVLPATIGRVRSQRKSLLTAMHERNLQLHREQTVIAGQARSRERTRIARDMHDSLGHQLTLISLYAGALGSAPEEQREEVIALLRSTSTAAMAELRQILGILRTEADEQDERANARPLTSLDDLVEASWAAGASVTLHREGTPRPLPALVEHAAYRVIQEGLTNAHKYAEKAWITVSLRYEPDALVAEVTNGPGRRRGQGGGQGLIGLAERARLAGGILFHEPTPIGGFRLAVTLPYDTAGGALALDAASGQPGNDAAGWTTPLAHDPAGGDAPLTHRPPGGDFAPLMRHSTSQSRRLWIGLTVTLAVMSLFCVGSAVLIRLLSDDLWVDEYTYDSIRVGDRERDVRDKLPSDGVGVNGSEAGPTPSGAKCVSHHATSILGSQSDDTKSPRYRFCFRDGVLVEKKAFAAHRPDSFGEPVEPAGPLTGSTHSTPSPGE